MKEIWAKIKSWNEAWHDLPRRLLIVLGTFIAVLFVVKSFKYLAPFIIALVFSWLILPIAKPLERFFLKIHLPRKIGDILAVTLVFGVLAALIWLLAAALMNEARDLLRSLPDVYKEVSDYLTAVAADMREQISTKFGVEAVDKIYEILMTALNKLVEISSTFAASMVSFTWSAVSSLPHVFLVVLFTIMESYYIVAERDDIAKFIIKWAPGNISDGYIRIKKVMFTGLRSQFVTAVVLMLVAFLVLMGGFFVLGVDYAVMLALLIAVLDALPVIGAGLIMLPMTGICILTGDYMLALGVFALYVMVLIVKRVCEPKLLGKQMRFTQLVTMIAMYAGFGFMGYLGLLAGPLMLMLFRALLPSDVPAIETAPVIKHRRKK